MTRILHLGCLLLTLTISAGAMISVGYLPKEKAGEMGVTMKQRKNGDAGTKVWLEIQTKGSLGKFTYIELRMTTPKDKHLLSARLQPNPVVRGQSSDLITASFSASPDQLKNCEFWIVCYGDPHGDVGYILKVADHLEILR
ncbi:MAG: hypothetical protein ACSHYF_10875 [Verrucomicrobiaceae bacterium]